MPILIDDYLRITVKDCKRMGYLTPNNHVSGTVKWTQGNKVIASVGLTTNLTGTVPYAVLNYTYKGTPVNVTLTLRYKPSNLKEGTGFYYFVCPVTGLSCRNLYLVNGRFVSRTAFRPLYRQQAERIHARNGSLAYLRALSDYEDLINAPYRRLTYKGKLTPYGRKVMKRSNHVDSIFNRVGHIADTKGWARV